MKKYLLYILTTVVLLGCATHKPPDYSQFFWPQPPEKARVKLLKVIRTNADIRPPSGLSALFGPEETNIFNKPHDVAVSPGGDTVYVSEPLRKAVYVLRLDGKGGADMLNVPVPWLSPLGMDFDPKNGLLAVADSDAVYIVDVKASKVRYALKANIERAVDAAFDPERQLIYVADTKKSTITVFDYKGAFVSTIAEKGVEQGKVFMPTSLDVDPDGRLYIVDTMNFRVQILGPPGPETDLKSGWKFERAIGSIGDKIGNLARPKGIAVTKGGLVLVTDAAFGNFQIFDKEGNIYMAVGRGGTNTPGYFVTPQGIAVDEEERIYVADSINRRIQIFQLMTDAYYEKKAAEEAAGKKDDKTEKK